MARLSGQFQKPMEGGEAEHGMRSAARLTDGVGAGDATGEKGQHAMTHGHQDRHQEPPQPQRTRRPRGAGLRRLAGRANLSGSR